MFTSHSIHRIKSTKQVQKPSEKTSSLQNKFLRSQYYCYIIRYDKASIRQINNYVMCTRGLRCRPGIAQPVRFTEQHDRFTGHMTRLMLTLIPHCEAGLENSRQPVLSMIHRLGAPRAQKRSTNPRPI